jgi:hypothetical protein
MNLIDVNLNLAKLSFSQSNLLGYGFVSLGEYLSTFRRLLRTLPSSSWIK